ncbi:MAG: hypothetical protein ACT4TC_25610 [Myxococcaceae bacterium]
MNVLRSPQRKLLLAGTLLVVLALTVPTAGHSASTWARVLVAVATIAGLGLWIARRKQSAEPGFSLAPKLEVLSRAGLSPRCGLALIEADGRKYLIVHGEGFARIRETRPDRRASPNPAPEVVSPAPVRRPRKLSLS